MNIAVVGLGLIGGSICRALKKHTAHKIYGIDADRAVCEKALCAGAIDEITDINGLEKAELTIISIYPQGIVDFVRENAARFKKGSVVADTCGVKEYIVSRCTPLLKPHGVTFIGCHPMAGREFSGFDYSTDDLFCSASFIITPTGDTPHTAVDMLSGLAKEMGFARTVISTPAQHDINIAFTSQLAHVVSNAYIKSPSLGGADGFSAGSFADLTRVAKLNENMWCDLFMCNKKALLSEIDNIIDRLTEYKNAMENDDDDMLKALLKDGRERKEQSMASRKADSGGKRV